MKKWAVNFFANPLVPGILTAIAPFFGVFIVLRNDHIIHLFHPQSQAPADAILGGWGDLVICIVLVLILVLFFALHKWAEATKNKERIDELGLHSNELKTSIEALNKIIETLPRKSSQDN